MAHAIRVSDETWKRLKVEAAQHGISLQACVENYIMRVTHLEAEVAEAVAWAAKLYINADESRETLNQIGAALVQAQATQDKEEI